MSGKYILNDAGEAVESPGLLVWANWFETADRQTARTDITEDIYVSTVFLGIDHRFIGDGPPILWETMVFGGDFDIQDRYSSRLEALAGHERVVEHVKQEHKENSS